MLWNTMCQANSRTSGRAGWGQYMQLHLQLPAPLLTLKVLHST